jgi:membrane carboxypeptidase/penicillin-binding protein PbpC
MFRKIIPFTGVNRKYIQRIFFVLLCSSFIFLGWIFLPILRDSQKSVNRVYILDRNGILMTDRSGKEGYSIKTDIPDSYSSVPFIEELIDIEDRRFQYHF